MVTRKGSDGIFSKRNYDRQVSYYWKIGSEKSKIFTNQVLCAMDYVQHYVEKNPKYQELVYDKTWDQLFSMFGIKITQR